MYDELYAAWKLETENTGLGSLPSDFYSRLADYLHRIKEDAKMIDSAGSVKAKLLQREGENANRMAGELMTTRFRKLGKLIISGRRVPVGSLTAEEQRFISGVTPSAEALAKFTKGILEGHVVRLDVEALAPAEAPVVHTRVTLRFLKPVPSIIGADMKSYGPFLVEDVASVPAENAKILVKQGLAKAVEA